VAWSGELGYGVRAPEPGQAESDTPTGSPDPMLVEDAKVEHAAKHDAGHDRPDGHDDHDDHDGGGHH
jgi:hypothetical protein